MSCASTTAGTAPRSRRSTSTTATTSHAAFATGSTGTRMEIEQVWQYGKERGQEFFSPYICNVEYYGEGHYVDPISGGIGREDGYASKALGPFLDAQSPNVELRSATVEEKDRCGGALINWKIRRQPTAPKNCRSIMAAKTWYSARATARESRSDRGIQRCFPEAEKIIERSAELPATSPSRKMKTTSRLPHPIREGTLASALPGKGQRATTTSLNTSATWHLAMCSGAFLEKDERDIKIVSASSGCTACSRSS